MNPDQPAPWPTPSLMEEWDNPAMTEFKRQEAEERTEFAQLRTQAAWREALKRPMLTDRPIALAPKTPIRFPFKHIHLPW